EIRHFLSDDAPHEYPVCRFRRGLRALAIVPICVNGALVGVVSVDMSTGGGALPGGILEPLFVYAGQAAVPLLVRRQTLEGERNDAARRRIVREILYSITGGKVVLCEPSEIDLEWPKQECLIPIRHETDIRVVREAARLAALEAGMESERAADFALSTSEA